MDNFLKTDSGFETTLKLVETINRSTDDYLFIWDIPADRRWIFGNVEKKYDICRSDGETVSTQDFMQIVYPADRATVTRELRFMANGEKEEYNLDYRWLNRQGDKVWVNCHGTLIRDAQNKPHLMIGRASEENLRHLYNPLTSLWNKVKLLQKMKHRLTQGTGYLMCLDVDNLAAINFAHGRAYGDALLKEIAEYLENRLGVGYAYHVDHNYFIADLENAGEEDVRDFYLQISEIMQDKCTLTAGAVPVSNQLFTNETQLLDSVNMTLKKAKEISNNRIEFFSPEDLRKRVSSVALLEEMKQSIENGYVGFEVYYQPQIHSGDYELYGVEALLRYTSPTRGMVYPDEFIPVLEQSRLICDVGMWVLEQALIQCKEWRKILPQLRVSVNFSSIQFEEALMAEEVLDKLRSVDLPGEALTIEITETVELHNNEQFRNTIKALKSFHINFAIDDFGTGYSNLGYLKQLNIDEIKIDRVFVSGIEKDTYNHKLISNVLEFAKVNSIRTCCEGVENMEELIILELLFPDVIQGYLFDKPNKPEAIERTYICPETEEYAARIVFLKKIQEYRMHGRKMTV